MRYSRRAESFVALKSSTAVALALCSTFAGKSFAQDDRASTQPPAADSPQHTAPSEVTAVVVTASRIVREDYEAPTPTTMVGAEDVAKLAPVSIADYVNRMPQLGAPRSPRTAAAEVSSGSGGANLLNGRGLGPSRTLVLLDGRRVIGGGITGAVDVNFLPTPLVQRVDIVTGGASAAWGSDAVATVVNFVLDTEFTGIKGNVASGQSFLGDGETLNADLSFGTQFADGRGHLLLSGSFADVNPINEVASRDWYTGYKAVPNPNRTATNGQSGFLALDHAGLGRATDGGVILSGPLAGTQFGPGGTILPYRLGDVSNGIIGWGGDVLDVAGRFGILPSTELGTLFSRASFDLNDDLSVYTEASWGLSDATNRSTPFVRHGDITIQSDNPFIPAGLDLTGVSSFNIGRTNWDLGMTLVRSKRETGRIVFGIDGKTDWFDDSFRWNGYVQHGRLWVDHDVYNNVIRANYANAIDAVRNPAVGGVANVAAGAPVCRSTLTNPTNGCVPLNPFGFGSPSQASMDYVLGEAWQKIIMKQDVAAAGAQADPFSTWAGPVSVAVGAEWRREQFSNRIDALDLANPSTPPYFLGNFKLGGGKYTVSEYFAEAVVPLVEDVPLVKSLDVNGAARMTDYSTSGTVTSWKFGATLDVNDELRFRATRSRDIRAPNLSDLFLGGQSSVSGILEPPGVSQVLVTTVNGGNPALKPEIADTKALGVLYRPSWLDGFSASVDYYSISIADAIISQSAQTIVNQCYGIGVPMVSAACDSITVTNPGTLRGAIIHTGGTNVALQEMEGFDIEVGYRADLDTLVESWRGQLELRAIGAYVDKFQSVTAGTVTNLLGIHAASTAQNGSALKWRWLGTATYTAGISSTTLSARYIGSGVFSNLPSDNPQAVDRNKIDSVTYYDLSQTLSFDVRGGKVELFAVIENLLDKDPPRVPNAGGAAYADPGTANIYFDLIGRAWRAGARFQF